MYTAYILNEDQQQFLKSVYPQKYTDFIGHHITKTPPTSKQLRTSNKLATIEVYGQVYNDVLGVQCLLVSVNGKYVRDGSSYYHITWSIDRSKGAKPVHSNKIILDCVSGSESSIKEIPPATIRLKEQLKETICQ